jgi:hypothetical protein
VCGIVATDAGGVRAAELVVRDVEEPLEHHWVRHTGEIPLRQNAVCVGVLKGPQRPLARALVRQQQVWREPVPARSTIMGGARRGW